MVRRIISVVLAISSFQAVLPPESAHAARRNISPATLTKAQAKRMKKRDRDFDYLSDYDEKFIFRTNPRKRDSNGNGVEDGDEDANRNGIPNEDEDDWKGKDIDSDGDGLDDEDENEWDCDPGNPDTDGNGVPDGNEDGDNNGIDNEDEDDRTASEFTEEDLDDDLQTPTPNPSPTPTPAPTPPPANRCYDSQGNTTCYGIPSGYVGNIFRGQTIWQSDCRGCHNEWLNRSYPQVNSAFSRVEAMAPFEPSLQDKIDLVAYLNRLNTR